MSEAERTAVHRSLLLLDRIREQIGKRQYMNSATAASRLSIELLGALSAVLKEADD